MRTNEILNEALPILAGVSALANILRGMIKPSMFERGHVLVHRHWQQIWGKTPVKLTPKELKKLDKLQQRAKKNQDFIEGKDFVGRLQAKPDAMLSPSELRNIGNVIRNQERTISQVKDIIKNAQPYAKPTASQTLKGPKL